MKHCRNIGFFNSNKSFGPYDSSNPSWAVWTPHELPRKRGGQSDSAWRGPPCCGDFCPCSTANVLGKTQFVRRLQRVRVPGKNFLTPSDQASARPATPPTKKQRCLVFVRICGGTVEVDTLELLDFVRPLKIKKYLSERSLGAHHYADGIPLIYNSPSGIHSLPCFAGNSSHWSSAGCKEFADLAGVRLPGNNNSTTKKNGNPWTISKAFEITPFFHPSPTWTSSTHPFSEVFRLASQPKNSPFMHLMRFHKDGA